MTELRLRVITPWLAVALAASVPLALFATRASRAWTVRVAMAALVVGAMFVVARSLARALRDVDPRHRIVNAVAATVALTAVVLVRAPDALAVLVAAPSAWLLAQSIGVVRVPGSGVHYAASVWNAARWLLTALAFVVAMTFKLFPDTARGYVGRVFRARTPVGVTWPDGGLRHREAVDASMRVGTPRVLNRARDADIGPVSDQNFHTPGGPVMSDVFLTIDSPLTVLGDGGQPVSSTLAVPSQEAEGDLTRWFDHNDASVPLQRKMAQILSVDPGARFRRSISREGIYGFAVTLTSGRTEGWIRDPGTGRVIPSDVPLRVPFQP